MIQRIQSLYLLLGFVALVLLFVFPFASISFNGETAKLFLDHFESNLYADLYNPLLILIISSMTALGFLISIFLFRNRTGQMRFNAMVFLFNAVLIFLIFWVPDQIAGELSDSNIAAFANYKSFGAVLPLLSMVLLVLANKAIKKDEIRVRMSNRVR